MASFKLRRPHKVEGGVEVQLARLPLQVCPRQQSAVESVLSELGSTDLVSLGYPLSHWCDIPFIVLEVARRHGGAVVLILPDYRSLGCGWHGALLFHYRFEYPIYSSRHKEMPRARCGQPIFWMHVATGARALLDCQYDLAIFVNVPWAPGAPKSILVQCFPFDVPPGFSSVTPYALAGCPKIGMCEIALGDAEKAHYYTSNIARARARRYKDKSIQRLQGIFQSQLVNWAPLVGLDTCGAKGNLIDAVLYELHLLQQARIVILAGDHAMLSKFCRDRAASLHYTAYIDKHRLTSCKAVREVACQMVNSTHFVLVVMHNEYYLDFMCCLATHVIVVDSTLDWEVGNRLLGSGHAHILGVAAKPPETWTFNVSPLMQRLKRYAVEGWSVVLGSGDDPVQAGSTVPLKELTPAAVASCACLWVTKAGVLGLPYPVVPCPNMVRALQAHAGSRWDAPVLSDPSDDLVNGTVRLLKMLQGVSPCDALSSLCTFLVLNVLLQARQCQGLLMMKTSDGNVLAVILKQQTLHVLASLWPLTDVQECFDIVPGVVEVVNDSVEAFSVINLHQPEVLGPEAPETPETPETPEAPDTPAQIDWFGDRDLEARLDKDPCDGGNRLCWSPEAEEPFVFPFVF